MADIKIFELPEYNKEKAKQEYEKAKNEYLKTNKKEKPKMSILERIAFNDAAPEDFELETKDKVYKKIKGGAATVDDIALGALTGDIASSVGKKVSKKITEKAMKKITNAQSKFWKDYPWLSDGIPAVRKMKEELGIKPLSTEEMLSIMSRMSPEEKMAADKAAMSYVNSRIKVDKLAKNQVKIDSVAKKSLIGGSTILGLILSPISTLSEMQDKKLSRDIKKKTLWKIYAWPGEHTDFAVADVIDSLSDKELDELIQKNVDVIKNMYSK